MTKTLILNPSGKDLSLAPYRLQAAVTRLVNRITGCSLACFASVDDALAQTALAVVEITAFRGIQTNTLFFTTGNTELATCKSVDALVEEVRVTAANLLCVKPVDDLAEHPQTILFVLAQLARLTVGRSLVACIDDYQSSLDFGVSP